MLYENLLRNSPFDKIWLSYLILFYSFPFYVIYIDSEKSKNVRCYYFTNRFYNAFKLVKNSSKILY